MWIRSRTFILFAISLSVMAILHIFATTFFLYWTYLWFDIPMHFLGGFVVALAFFVFFGAYAQASNYRGIMITLGAVLAVGVVWEIFEWVGVIERFKEGYAGDTALDLIMDIVGGMVGYVCARTGFLQGHASSQ